jgi:MFS family permease
LAAEEHWTVYLPVLLLSLGLMVPLVIQAEGHGRAKPVFLMGIAALGAACLGFAVGGTEVLPLLVLLVLFFTAVNLLEALLPSLVTKTCPAGAKGTAMGVYTTSQFMGAFLGGVLGGAAQQFFGPEAVFLVAALAALVWLVAAATMTPPERVTSQVIALAPGQGSSDVLGIQRRLLAVPGVRDALVVPEEGVAYLKVDSRELDSARLQAVSAGG